ncbi:hypothetical protein [Deinococcus fonticola]|uniref:hypothetical protein n=1 Tax=Deinococcus fonticola TaxID=2528713 RepID=UPI00107587D2|nr:hypothetical protein [Deinococcus fonticola]
MLRSKNNQSLPLYSVQLSADDAGNPITGTLELADDGRSFRNMTGLSLGIGTASYGPLRGIGEYNFDPNAKTTTLPVVQQNTINWGDSGAAGLSGKVTFGQLLNWLDPNLAQGSVWWLSDMWVHPPFLEQLKPGRDTALQLLQPLGYRIVQDDPDESAHGVITPAFAVEDIVFDAPHEFASESMVTPSVPRLIRITGAQVDPLREAIDTGIQGVNDGDPMPDTPETKAAVAEAMVNPNILAPTVRWIEAGEPAPDPKNPGLFIPTEPFARMQIIYHGLPDTRATELQVMRPSQAQVEDMRLGLLTPAAAPDGSWESLSQAKPGELKVAYISNAGPGTYWFRVVPVNYVTVRNEKTGTPHLELRYGMGGAIAALLSPLTSNIGLKATAFDGRVALTWMSQSDSKYLFTATQVEVPGQDMSPQPNPKPQEFEGYGAAWLENLDPDTRWTITVERVFDTPPIDPNAAPPTESVTVDIPYLGAKADSLSVTASSSGATLSWEEGGVDYVVEITRNGKRVVWEELALDSKKTKIVDHKHYMTIGGLLAQTEYTISMWPKAGKGWDDRYVTSRQFITTAVPEPEDKTAEDIFAEGNDGTYTSTATADGQVTTTTLSKSGNTITSTTETRGKSATGFTRRNADGTYTTTVQEVLDALLSSSTTTTVLDAAQRELSVTKTTISYDNVGNGMVKVKETTGEVVNTWSSDGHLTLISNTETTMQRGPDGAFYLSDEKKTTESWARVNDAGIWSRTVSGWHTVKVPLIETVDGKPKTTGWRTERSPISESAIGTDTPRRVKDKNVSELVEEYLEDPLPKERQIPTWSQLSLREEKSDIIKAQEAAEKEAAEEEEKKREETGANTAHGGTGAGFTYFYELNTGGHGDPVDVAVAWAWNALDLETIAQNLLLNYRPTITRVRHYFTPVGARRNAAVRSVEITDGPDGFIESVTTRSLT